MTRPISRTTVMGMLVAGLALAGCDEKSEPRMTAMAPPAATATVVMPPELAVMPAPIPATLTVSSVDLGNSIGADNRVDASLTSFARTDTVHASVATDGASSGKLTARWMAKNGRVIDSQDKSVPAGPGVTGFSIRDPNGWPVGTYTLQLSTDGVVVQSRAFEIR